MTTRVAVAAGGNWGTAATWNPSGIPTASDDLYLNATSGNVVIASSCYCRSLNCTGYTGTLSTGSSPALYIGTSTSGNLTLVAGMTATLTSLSLYLVSTTTGNLITTAGKSLGYLYFSGSGGSWTLQDNLTMSQLSTSSVSLNTAGHTVTGTDFTITSGTVTLGASTVNVTNWSCSSSATLSSGTSSIVCKTAFYGGGKTYNDISQTAPVNFIVYNNFTCNNFTFTGGSSSTSTTLAGTLNTITVTGTFTANGNNASTYRALISNLSINAAAVSFSNADFHYVTGSGSASWNLSAVTGGSGNCGGNSGITFTTAITCYAKTGTSVNWTDAFWFTTSGGSTAARVPLPQDTARFDANSITAGSVIITYPSTYKSIPNANWTSVTNSPAWKFDALTNVYGTSIILSSGMSVTSGGAGSPSFAFINGGTTTITTDGVTIPFALDVERSTTVVQSDNLVCSSDITVGTVYYAATGNSSGSWDANGNNLTCDSATFTRATVTLGPSLTLSSLSVDSAAVITTSGNTLNLTGAANYFYNYSSSAFNNVTVSSSSTVEVGGTFSILGTLTFGAGDTVTFYSGYTYTIGTISWTGSSGSLITIKSDSAGSSFVVYCSNVVSCDYLSLKDCHASGNTPFYAGSHSTNVSGNTNWQFTGPDVSLNSIVFSFSSLKSTGNQSTSVTGIGTSAGTSRFSPTSLALSISSKVTSQTSGVFTSPLFVLLSSIVKTIKSGYLSSGALSTILGGKSSFYTKMRPAILYIVPMVGHINNEVKAKAVSVRDFLASAIVKRTSFGLSGISGASSLTSESQTSSSGSLLGTLTTVLSSTTSLAYSTLSELIRNSQVIGGQICAVCQAYLLTDRAANMSVNTLTLTSANTERPQSGVLVAAKATLSMFLSAVTYCPQIIEGLIKNDFRVLPNQSHDTYLTTRVLTLTKVKAPPTSGILLSAKMMYFSIVKYVNLVVLGQVTSGVTTYSTLVEAESRRVNVWRN